MCVAIFLSDSTIEVFASEISNVFVDADDNAVSESDISEDDVNLEDASEDDSDLGENSDEEYSQEVYEYVNIDEELVEETELTLLKDEKYEETEVVNVEETFTVERLNAASYSLTYTVSNGEATITGYTGTASGDLVIPEYVDDCRVTEIGYRAFDGCSEFTGSLIIPDSVTTIGNYAFQNCRGFKGSLTIGNRVESIGEYAFRKCSGIECIVLNENINEIKKNCFAGCTSLQEIVFKSMEIENIDEAAFESFAGICYFPAGTEINRCKKNRSFCNALWISYNDIKDILKWNALFCENAIESKELITNIDEPSKNSIEIDSIEELASISEGEYVLTDDLIIDSDSWYGIKTTGAIKIDGQGHKIINKSNYSLFNYVPYDCVIKNLIYIQTSKKALGMIEYFGPHSNEDGKEYKLQIHNCGVLGYSACAGFVYTVNAEGYTSSSPLSELHHYYTYGNVSIDNCFSDISIFSTVSYAGGFVGEIKTITHNAGRNNGPASLKVDITNSTANVQLVGADYAGGMIGHMYQCLHGEGYVNFSNCSVSGVINADTCGGYIGGEFCDFSSYSFNPVFFNCESLCETSQWDGYTGGNFIGELYASQAIFKGINYYDYEYKPVATGGRGIEGRNTIFHISNKGLINNTSTFFTTFVTSPTKIIYSNDGFSCNEIAAKTTLFNMNMDTPQVEYEEVVVNISLPQGLSFSKDAKEYEKKISIEKLGSGDNGILEFTDTLYIDKELVVDEYEIVISVTAKGFDKPQNITIYIPVTMDVEQPQSSIMDVVDKYTSQDAIRGLEEIWNANYSGEELKTHLYEYFCCDNLYDVKDNITKLQDSHDERWAYNGLICNDMYCASQWNSYLNSDEGIITRAALVASGLAFNGELGDWLSVSTYLDGEYPGVKKYKSLLEEYINDNKVEMEFYSYIKTCEKFVNGTAKSISSTQKANFLKGFGKTKNVAEAHTVFNDFVYENLNGFLDDETHEIRVEKKTPLMEAFGTSHTIFKMTNVTVGGIEDFVAVESNIEAYKTCKSFLDEIIAADDLPLEMRMAASQLEEEYEKEYWAPVENILNQIRDECLDEALDLAGFSNVLDVNGYLTAIEYVSFVMNQVVDVGAMVKNSAYTEGYAKLAEHWCSKIETDKANYLKNRNEENAWAFYDDYMTLWKLRVLGEKKYLKMNQLEGGKVVDGISDAVFGGNLAGVITEATGYADKEAAVNEILERLDSFKFQLDGSISVPEQYQYLQKVMVECPVDVEILSSNGSQVCVMKDGVESDTTNEYGRFKIVYRPTTGDFVKIAYFYANDRYTIKAVGNKAGKVSYTVATTDDNVNCEVKGFGDVVIDKDSVIEMDTKSDDYLVDFDGDGQNIVTGKNADKSKLYAQFDFQNGSEIDVVYADENGYVTAPVPSERSGYKFMGWYTEPNGEGTCLFNYYYDSMLPSSELISEHIVLYAYWVESDIEWSINTVEGDVILSLTGTGSIVEEKHPWDESKDTITRIEINGNITGVERNAFYWCSNLSSVYIGSSVKNVHPKAFSGCNSLIQFEISNVNRSYCSIDGVLFSKDKEMLVRFPEGISGSYNVPSGTTKIGDFAFSKEMGGKESIVLGGINEVFLPNTVKSIGKGAFQDCQNLTNVTMTDSVEKIGEYCFDGTGLTDIRLSNNILEIPKYALSSGVLKTVVVSNRLQSIGSYAFGYGLKTLYSNGSEEQQNSVILPSTLIKVSQCAFSYSGVESIRFNSSNLYFEEGILHNCRFLKDVHVGRKIANIPDYSFRSESIERVTLMSSVTSIGNNVFWCHDGLVINLYTLNAPELSENTFYKFSPEMKIVVNVPVDAKGYDVEPWTNFTINKVLDLSDEENLPWEDPVNPSDPVDPVNPIDKLVCAEHSWKDVEVFEAATYKKDGSKKVECEKCGATDVHKIDKLVCTEHSWKDDKVLMEASYREEGSMQIICEKCGKTDEKVIPKLECTEHKWTDSRIIQAPTSNSSGKKEVKCEVCGETKSVEISKIVKGATFEDPTCGIRVKVNNAKNKTVSITKTINKNSTKIVIPKTIVYEGVTYKVNEIADKAFANNKKLKTVTIGSNITSIGSKAFYKCTALKSVVIPAKVTKIGSYAFYGCKNLKKVQIKTDKLTDKKIGTKAFTSINSKAVVTVSKKKYTSYKKILKKKGITKKTQKIKK